MSAVKDVRLELSRLILDGLCRRSLDRLWDQLRATLQQQGDSISWQAFHYWVIGRNFPSTKKRQNILADVVGGPCGEAIRTLPAPAFRGYRQRIMKENDMGHASAHGSDGRKARKFPHETIKGDDGIMRSYPEINCSQCGQTGRHTGRRGSMEDGEIFHKMGWEVGGSAAYDVCPSCVASRKVVKMEDHVKAKEVEAGVISGEDGRILSRYIEDHWDEMNKRYLPGWSDVKLAAEMSRPVEHVRQIRERDFPGGVGEDPQLTDFLAVALSVKEELGGLHGHMEELAASVSALSSQHDKVQRVLEKYRDAHNALAGKMKRVSEVADKLAPFEGAA